MKKVISLVLVLAICFTMVSVVSAKKKPDIDIEIPDVEGYAGYDVEVDVNIIDNKGFSVLGLNFYWDEGLTLKGVKNKLNDLPEGYVNAAIDTDVATANEQDPPRLYIGFAPAATQSQVEPENITYTGRILTLVFTVSDELQIGDEVGVYTEITTVFDNEQNELTNDESYEGYITIAEKTFTTGDFDGDDEVTDADAVYLLMYTFFPEDYPINQPGDYDGDGDVTDADAVYLLMYTFFPDDYPIQA